MSYPSLDHVRAAARLAIDHGADFVKTSTGKTAVSATLAASVMILDAIRESAAGQQVGFKPSGRHPHARRRGPLPRPRRRDDGPRMGDARTTFRFGASGLLDALEAELV